MSQQRQRQTDEPAGNVDPFAHMVAILRGVFVLPELRAPGRYVQPLELRRLALGFRQEDEPE